MRGTVQLRSSAPAAELAKLKEVVDAHCPVLDILRAPVPVDLKLDRSARFTRLDSNRLAATAHLRLPGTDRSSLPSEAQPAGDTGPAGSNPGRPHRFRSCAVMRGLTRASRSLAMCPHDQAISLSSIRRLMRLSALRLPFIAGGESFFAWS